MSYETIFEGSLIFPEYEELENRGFSRIEIARLAVAQAVVTSFARSNAILSDLDIVRFNRRPGIEATLMVDPDIGTVESIYWGETRVNPDTSIMSDAEAAIERSADLGRSALVLWDTISVDGMDVTSLEHALRYQSLEDISDRDVHRSVTLGFRDRSYRFRDESVAENSEIVTPYVSVVVEDTNQNFDRSGAKIYVRNLDHARTLVRRAVAEVDPFNGRPIEPEAFYDRIARLTDSRLEIGDGYHWFDM